MKHLHVCATRTPAFPLDAVTQTFGILAVRGAGKSNTAVVMAEEMFAAKLPFVVIDPVGNWWGLRAGPDGKSSGLAIPIFGGQHGDVPLEKTGGSLVADLVVDQRLSAILDVSEFSEGDKIHFLIDFAERLYRRNTDPLHLFLEEADDYCPQKPFREQARLVGAWERVVKRGRSRGLGITMITQRSAVLNKNVLTQIETLMVLRTTSPQDRKAIEAWVEHHGQSKEIIASLPSLKNGEAWLWSPNWLGICERVGVRRRQTYDSSATPTMSKRAAASLADIDLPAIRERMAATIEKVKAEDPKELRRQIIELKAAQKKLVDSRANPPMVIKQVRVEVPAMKEGQVKRLEALADKLTTAGRILMKEFADFGLAVAVLKNKTAPNILLRQDQVPVRPSAPTSVRTPAHAGASLPIGEKKVLTVVCQYPDGASREQITVLTGYKRSSRDAYLQRLLTKGYVVIATGGLLNPTADGEAALGTGFEPLLAGHALQKYWLERLPEGERRLLEAIIAAYPSAIDRDTLEERTGYKRSSRDAYLQRLKSRQLIDLTGGRGMVRASQILFD
jgi:uncharacterized protein DUF87